MIKIIFFLILFNSVLNAKEKYYINEINFVGNIGVSDNELESIIKLKKPKLFRKYEFTQKMFNRDIQNLIGYYISNGFRDVKIVGLHENGKEHHIIITYNINEGPQYILKNIIMSGNKHITDDVVRNYFSIQIDMHFNPTFIRNQLISLKREYLRNGNLDIFIIDELIIDDTDIVLRLNISEGIYYSIKKINIFGLKAVDKKYIQREILFMRDEIYDINKIDLTRKRIFDSGIFSSVEIFPEKNLESQGFVDININVREYKSSSIELDIGFSELSAWQDPLMKPGFDMGSRWVIGNLMNGPSKIILSGMVASEIDLQSLIGNENLKQIHTRIVYKSPWTLSFRVPTELRLFYEINNDKYENLKTYGFSHLIYFKINSDTRYDVRSTYEKISTEYEYSSEDTEPVRSIEFSYTINKINNIIRPSDGYYLRLSSTLFGTFLGGERNFFQVNNEFRKYFPISSRNILAFRYKMGYIYNINETENLPFYYKYKLGGQTSLRGWLNTEQYDDSEGKLIYDMVNLEYRFPLYRKWGGGLFIDTGRLYNQINDFFDINLSWNYGVGITYNTAFGPFRIEYAIPYIRSNNYQTTASSSDRTETGIVHASLLYMF